MSEKLPISGDRARGQTGFRQTNIRRVVDELRSGGPRSQAGLARATDLSASTVNAIVRRLEVDGVVRSVRANGRESIVELSVRAGRVAAVRAAPDEVRASIFDFDEGRRTDARYRGGAPGRAGIAVVEDVIRRVVEQAGIGLADLDVIAVGVQAPIAADTGALAAWAADEFALWRGVPIADALATALGTEVIVENDANLAALAEWTWGAGAGSSDFFYALCSGHVGGALVIDGRIYQGGGGLAGEIGHVVVNPAGPLCFCGSRGCLTTYASERALLGALAATHPGIGSLTDFVAAARDGNLAARGLLAEVGAHLGRALADVGKIMAPQRIVVGGELRSAGKLLSDALMASIELTSLRAAAPSIQVLLSALPGDEVVLGALAHGLDRLGRAVSVLPDWARV